MPLINFSPFPVLSTQRFTLRPMTIHDENEVFALRSDVEGNKYLDRKIPEAVSEVRDFILMIEDLIKNNKSVFWAISLKDSAKLIGTICLWNISPDNSKAEIGYELLREYQGKGIMQEAVNEVVRYGFKDMKLKIIEAVVHKDNLSSTKLLERNNFVLNGFLYEVENNPDENPAMLIYSLEKKY